MLLPVCVLSLTFRFIYETEHFNGVAELLEILGRFVCKSTRLNYTLLLCCTHTYTLYMPAVPVYETAGTKNWLQSTAAAASARHIKQYAFLFFLLSYQVKTTQGDGKGNESKQGRGMSKGVRWAMVQKGEKREEVGVKDINEI